MFGTTRLMKADVNEVLMLMYGEQHHRPGNGEAHPKEGPEASGGERRRVRGGGHGISARGGRRSCRPWPVAAIRVEPVSSGRLRCASSMRGMSTLGRRTA
jgi:hypothetical protein